MARLAWRARQVPAEMTFGGHLRELQVRTIKAALGVVVGLVVGWAFYDPIFQFLQQPMVALSGESDRLVAVNFAGLGSAFTVQLKVAVFVGLVVSAPWWLYQAWAFVRPGLLPRERRQTVVVLAASLPLFLAGALLAWYVLPSSVRVLTGFAPAYTATMVSADVYFDFVLRIITAFGLAFLVPVVMVALSVVGLVGARSWLKGWRWAILLAFLFAALASPSGDVLTMTVLGAPICVLYFAAVGICAVWERRLVRRIEREGLAG